MAGHNKWANIKYRKMEKDARRDKIFTKIIRDLVTAARLGGANLSANPRLRAIVEKALSYNMARDTLNRAIARGIGNEEDNSMETFVYEGYGPGGIAILVECLSNNRNRTVSLVRHAFNKHGGNLGMDGSVAYLFSKKGVISFEHGEESIITEAALEAGADDVVIHSNSTVIDVVTSWDKVLPVCNVIEMTGIRHSSVKIIKVPLVEVTIDRDNQLKLLRLINMLEDYDDVQAVYHNGKCYYSVTTTTSQM